MTEFWDALTTLIQQYTIADTANVISIIEGIATVVAAVAAIIAVVISKKIALKQISIAEKQSEVSMKQADIAQQQNRIALFRERNEAYKFMFSYLLVWSAILGNINGEITSKIASKAWHDATDFRIKKDPELRDLVYISKDKKSDIYFTTILERDILYFQKIRNLFDLTKKSQSYISDLQLYASAFTIYGVAPEQMKPDEAAILIQRAKDFFNVLEGQKNNFLLELESQIKITK